MNDQTESRGSEAIVQRGVALLREPSAKYLVGDGYKRTEVGFIPDSWDVKPLRDMSVISSGGTPSRVRADYWDGDVPWITTSQINFSCIEAAEQFISKNGLQNSATKLLSPGTLLLALYGQGKTRGKVGVLGIEAATNQACAAIEITRDVSSDFLLHYLASQYEAIRGMSNGGSQDNLNSGIVKRILVPVPTSVEQRAIATALSDVDALIAGLERLIVKKRDIKQAIMQQLLTGQTRLPGFSVEWEAKRLGLVGDCLRGVAYRGDADLFRHDTEQTKRLLRSNNVQDAMVVATDVQFVNAACVSEHQILRAGDVLICMANGSKSLVGKAGYFDRKDGFQYTFGAFMGVFRCTEVAVRRFIFYLFQTGRYRDYVNNLLAGSSINNLSPASVMSLEFSFPEKEEQTAIATVLSDMDADLSTLESRLAKTRAIKQGMMQELLTGRTRLI